jgi:hypothetical protein
MQTLFIHVGHGKTGSSWLQAAFRINRALLAANGLRYPALPDEPAEPGAITMGNAKGLCASAEMLDQRLAGTTDSGVSGVVFSSETLFNELREGPIDAKTLVKSAAHHGFSRVSVLMLLRDPIGQAISHHGQRIKRGGICHSVEETMATFDVPIRALALIQRLEAEPAIDLRLRNYSRCRDRLLDEVTDWLGVPRGVLPAPPVGKVNRSLNRGETILMQVLNKHLRHTGPLLADPLCERLADVPDSVLPAPDYGAQKALWERLAPAIDEINQRLPVDHHYRADFREPAEYGDPVLSEAQLELIGDCLGAEIARLRAENARLHMNLTRKIRAWLGHRLPQALRRLRGRTA